MNKKEISIAIEVMQAIHNGRLLCDDNDEHDYMVLVDENRLIKEDLKPLKSLIKRMEKEGLIIQYDEINEKREYMKLLGQLYPVSFVYLYSVTDKGDGLEL